MSDIRLKKITIEPSQELLIQNGNVLVSSTTASTNKTTGALVINGGIALNCTHNATNSTSGGALSVGGGLAVSRDVYINGNITQSGISSTFSIAGDVLDRLNIAPTSSPGIYMAPNGVTKVFELGENDINVNYTAPSTNSTSGSIKSLGGLSIACTENATSTTVGGALTIAGGTAITKSLFVGQTVTSKGLKLTFPPDNFQLVLDTTGGNTTSITTIGEKLQVSGNTGITLHSSSGSIDTLISTTQISSHSSSLSMYYKPIRILDSTNATGTTTASIITEGGIISKSTGGSLITLGSATIGGTLTSQDSIGIDITNNSKNNKIVLYQSAGSLASTHQFTGLGVVTTGSLRYQVHNGSNDHIFYSGTSSVSSTELFRISGSTGTLTLKGLLQSYRIIGGGSTQKALSFQGQSAFDDASVDFFTNDGTILDNNTVRIFGQGTPEDITNSEYVSMGWKTNRNHYSIKVLTLGSGAIRDLALESGIDDQIVLGTSGQVMFGSTIASLSSTSGALYALGGIGIKASQDSTSHTAGGAMTIAGGASIEKALHVGTQVNIGTSGTTKTTISSIETRSASSTTSNTVFTSQATDSAIVVQSSSGSLLQLITFGVVGSTNVESFRIRSTSVDTELSTTASGTGTSKPIKINASPNTGQVYLATNGNVGINTTIPSTGFHVDSNIYVSGNATMGQMVLSTLAINSTLDSTALVLSGGITVNKSAVIVGQSTIGAISITSTATNSLATLGGCTIAKTLNVTQEFTCGNARVSNMTTATLMVTSTTDTASTTTGSITLLGGIGIVKGIHIGGTSTFRNTSTFIKNGTVQIFKDETSVTRMALNKEVSTNDLTVSRYNSSGTFVDNIIEFSNTSGNTRIIHAASVKETLSALDTTDSVSTTSGSIIVSGGVGIAKGMYIGGTVRLNSTTQSNDVNSGSLIVSGGAAIQKNLSIGGDAVITGNLYVNGTTTNIVSTTVSISDNIIHLNAGPSGSKDAGLFIERYQTENNIGTGDVVSDARFLSDTLPSQTGMVSTQIKLSSSASNTDEFYNGWYIKVTSGFSSNQVRLVTSYIGSSRIATIQTAWTTQNPSISDTVQLYNKAYVGLMYTESSDEFILGSTVTDPSSDTPTISDHSSLKLWRASFVSTETATNATSGGIVTLAGIGINNTANASSNTAGGSITSRGGAAFEKNVYIGGNLVVNSVAMTPNSGDILQTITFTAANNQSSQTDITGLLISSIVYGADIYLSSRLDATTDLYAHFHIRIVNKQTSWEISKSYVGDETGLDFYITSGGQIQYTSSNYTGFTSLTFKYRVFTNS